MCSRGTVPYSRVHAKVPWRPQESGRMRRPPSPYLLDERNLMTGNIIDSIVEKGNHSDSQSEVNDDKSGGVGDIAASLSYEHVSRQFGPLPRVSRSCVLMRRPHTICRRPGCHSSKPKLPDQRGRQTFGSSGAR